MATVRNPNSLAARKMRMAISLRLAARSFRIGLVFFISEAINGSREILHCFMATTRLSSSVFNSENQLFLCFEKGEAAQGSSHDLWIDWNLGCHLSCSIGRSGRDLC